MIPIKHILLENGVKEIFKFIVPSGTFQGEYIIDKPGGWDEVDSVVNIDDESMNVNDFIIGNNTKLRFYQEKSKTAYNLLKNVYAEQQGDGRIIFKWLAVKAGIEYDLLKDNFEVNMNKYYHSYDKFYFKIEVELIKSESQNKLINRDDVTIDLFADKDLDENPITPVETFNLGYKKGAAKQSNFYSWDVSQLHVNFDPRTAHFYSFHRSDDYQFGNNTNEYAGIKPVTTTQTIDQGPFVSTNITLKSIKIRISNMHIICGRLDNNIPVPPDVGLYAVVSGAGFYYTQLLQKFTSQEGNSSIIEIDNKIFNFHINNSSNLMSGQNLSFLILSNSVGDKFITTSLKLNTSIEITTNMESPIVSTKGIRLIDSIKQVVKNYTASGLGVLSNYIGSGGIYYNTSISTGIYLRGLPDKYTTGQKVKTSFKSLMTDGASKLLALGYDILDQNIIIEDIGYFFKDVKCYDLSDKKFIQDGYKFENDKDVVYNTMIFGSKKYSKNVKDDIQNYITSAEFTTPIVRAKNKLDKQTELIIDEYKIQELIEDKSSSTNDNDDDLVMIDMVEETNYSDTGVFENCVHANKNGKLVLTCTSIAFDTTFMEVGSTVNINEGLNQGGPYNILNINNIELTLDKSSGIQEGINDTPITYTIPSLIKNRSINDGFTEPSYIRDPATSTNARHNPKYHMARWFQWFGSGLRKKQNGEFIKVTSYKNNEKARMKANSGDLLNELPGLVEVGANEPLSRLRSYKTPFFSGEVIEIKFLNVTFQEFIMMYENWRYGISGDRSTSRGYLTIPTPQGIYDAYPFGDAAFSHDRKTNVLSFKGKIKSKSAEDPVLLSVVQDSKNTVTLHWDYTDDYINPIVDVQYSIDGVNWITIRQFGNTKQGVIVDDAFLEILSGTNVSFRLIVNTLDFINKISNTISVNWKYNPYAIVARNKSENTDCGYSRIVFDLKGKANFEIEYSYEFTPSGGKLWATNLNGTGGNLVVETNYGQTSVNGVETRNINIDGSDVRLYIDLFNSDKTEALQPLNCTFGDYQYSASGILNIKFTDTITNTIQNFDLKAETIKLYS
ncbi:hypothetical protein [Chryseobacterium sp. SG20098]|uniref:hypothetical protein n=1 Tax=Chryseobacterium sp. SG20098 TaxID=3074145 RepID=UPI002883154A|nr:hypothetical protein [Chryseobacterium sp. SG20098]WNI34737.1 hypothetical protein RHP76_12185 [Chryseobacterium sp. SG20098]